MSVHVYQYCAQWQVPQRSHLLSLQDGIFRSPGGKIETFACYQTLKRVIFDLIPPGDRPADHTRITVLNLSYLGEFDE